jgi:eukaryotic-like serine/threonine-protein kinase
VRCPDENVLAGYVDGGLDRKQRSALERHIDGCRTCRAIVSDLARVAHDSVGDSIGGSTMRDENDGAFAPTSIAPPARVAMSASIGESTLEESMRARPVQLVPGSMVGEYEITGIIGAGGMGSVYSAIHPRIGKQAAVKVLQRQLAGDPAALVRFENEAKAVNEIRHPNIVDIFAFGELPGGNPYFVMERVDGESLQTWLEKRGRLSLERAMPILSPIFDALEAAHERGIVHRDLKPGNIMIAGTDASPRVTVLDFGLAKMSRKRAGTDDDLELTIPGIAMGTPLFMPPEQFLGEQVDHRADIYALAVIVYQMVTGRYPFAGNTPTMVGMQHVVDAPPPPSSVIASLSAQLDAVLLKGLAKSVDDRFSSMREFREALAACIDRSALETMQHRHARAVTPIPAASGPALARPRRSLPLVIAIGIAAGAALGAAAFLINRSKSTPGSEPATVPIATPAPTPMPVVPPPAPAVAAPAQPAQSAPPAPPAPVEQQPEAHPVATVEPAAPTPPASAKHTKPHSKTKPATGSAATKPPCDPYKSLDGC